MRTTITVLTLALLFASGPASTHASGTLDAADVPVSSAATLFPGDQKNLYEPSVAIDPTNPDNMIAFAIDLSVQNEDPSMWSTTRFYQSSDGGRTWADRGPVPYAAGQRAPWQSGDPVAIFTPDGTAYYASLADPPDGVGGTWVHRSDDGGTTWEPPVLAVASARDEDADACRSTDKEWLSHDATRDRLYLAVTLFSFQCSSLGDPLGADVVTRLNDLGLYITYSDDQGRTWAEPQEIWDGYALGGMPKAGPDGTLYITFWTTVVTGGGCPTVLGVLTAKGGGRPFGAVVVGSSSDGGATWKFEQNSVCPHDFAELVKPGRFVGGNFLPALAVDDTTGTAFAAWPDFDPLANKFSVKVVRSSSSGASWSEPVNMTPGLNDARMPALHATGGTARLAYVENDEEGAGHTLMITSEDDGSTWSPPQQMSTERARLEGDPDIGDYITIDIAAGRLAVVWTDARKGSPTEIWVRTGNAT